MGICQQQQSSRSNCTVHLNAQRVYERIAVRLGHGANSVALGAPFTRTAAGPVRLLLLTGLIPGRPGIPCRSQRHLFMSVLFFFLNSPSPFLGSP